MNTLEAQHPHSTFAAPKVYTRYTLLGTRASNLVVFILGYRYLSSREYVPGYPESMYPGTPRACTPVPQEHVPRYPEIMYPGIPSVCTRVSRKRMTGYPDNIYTLLSINISLQTFNIITRFPSNTQRMQHQTNAGQQLYHPPTAPQQTANGTGKERN